MVKVLKHHSTGQNLSLCPYLSSQRIRLEPFTKPFSLTPNEVEGVKKDVNKAIHQTTETSQLNNNREIETLQEKLKQAIKEERYEDAAKIRDEIKQKESK